MLVEVYDCDFVNLLKFYLLGVGLRVGVYCVDVLLEFCLELLLCYVLGEFLEF